MYSRGFCMRQVGLYWEGRRCTIPEADDASHLMHSMSLNHETLIIPLQFIVSWLHQNGALGKESGEDMYILLISSSWRPFLVSSVLPEFSCNCLVFRNKWRWFWQRSIRAQFQVQRMKEATPSRPKRSQDSMNKEKKIPCIQTVKPRALYSSPDT